MVLVLILLGLLPETDGTIEYLGQPRDIRSHAKRKEYWKNIQSIFQDPFSTFNQFFRVEKILNDCLDLQGLGHLKIEEKREKMKDACKFVNLKYEELYNKYPFELSGGQMLLKLRDEKGMTILFITHDLGLAYYVSDTLYIMEHGKMVETGPADELILHPNHRYTKQLVADVPKLNEEWDLDD